MPVHPVTVHLSLDLHSLAVCFPLKHLKHNSLEQTNSQQSSIDFFAKTLQAVNL